MPEVVFLPGFMQHADSWSRVAAAVGERYPSRVLEFTTWSYEERLDEIRRGTGDGDVLVGYSMGGRLALHAALGVGGGGAAAHRDAAAASPQGDAAAAPAPIPLYCGLVLLGSSAGIEDAGARERRALEDAALAAWIEASSIEAVVDRWELNPVFASQDASVVAGQRPGRLAHSPADLARLLRSAGQGALDPVWDRLGELRIPVLAIAGANDSTYWAAAQRIASLVADGRAVAIEGAGHAAHLEQPEAVAATLLEWLETTCADFAPGFRG